MGRISRSSTSRIAILSWSGTSTSSATRTATMTTGTAIRTITTTPMLEYDFMRTAFAASGLAALAGLVGFTFVSGIGMGLFGEKLAERDVAIGMMLSLALGLGLLFLHFYTTGATQAAALLFGNVLGVDESALVTLALLSIASLVALAAIARPLIFASLQPDLAEARGVPIRFVSVAFLAIVGIAVAECAQIVGVLLVFTLMVGPAAAAQNFSRRLISGVLLAAALALAEAWGGLTLAFYTDWPTSFWITALSGLVYLASLLTRLWSW